MMIRNFFFLSLFFICQNVFADPAATLGNLLQSTHTIQADFSQVVYDEDNRALSTSLGFFILQEPNKFYWEITKPSKQIIVNDGKNMWNYQPDLEQVVVSKATNALEATPLAILSGSIAALNKNFTISQVDSNTFKLVAKQTGTFKYVWLYFSKGVINGMKLQDALGQNTQLQFSHVSTNTAVSSTKFMFTVPDGVDVIHN